MSKYYNFEVEFFITLSISSKIMLLLTESSFGPYGMTSQQIFSVWTKLKVLSELYCIPTQVKLQKVSVFLCYYGLKFSRSIRQSVRRRMDWLSANQILAFCPYFVWYTMKWYIIKASCSCCSSEDLHYFTN